MLVIRLRRTGRKKQTTYNVVVAEKARAVKGKFLEKVVETVGKYGIDKEYLLYTGVHRDHKNVVGLIGAFAKLIHEHGFDGYLVITGK